MSYKSKSSKKSKLNMLDLHGYKTADVYDAVEKFLSKNTNKSQVKIMTGKGSGAVKKEVLNYLRQAHYPWHYETLPNGSRNEGVLIIEMD